MDPVVCVHLVRHGRVHNPGGVVYGRLPRFGLSDRGRADAAAAGRVLAGRPVSAVFASPLLRARQTARILAAALPGAVVRRSRLITEVLTPYQGRPLAEARAVGEDFYTGAPPGFERPDDVAARMVRFLRRVASGSPAGDVAAVTHGDPVAFLVLRLAGLPLDPDRKARLEPAGIPDGYPAPGSVTTLAVPRDRPEAARVVAYRSP